MRKCVRCGDELPPPKSFRLTRDVCLDSAACEARKASKSPEALLSDWYEGVEELWVDVLDRSTFVETSSLSVMPKQTFLWEGQALRTPVKDLPVMGEFEFLDTDALPLWEGNPFAIGKVIGDFDGEVPTLQVELRSALGVNEEMLRLSFVSSNARFSIKMAVSRLTDEEWETLEDDWNYNREDLAIRKVRMHLKTERQFQ